MQYSECSTVNCLNCLQVLSPSVARGRSHHYKLYRSRLAGLVKYLRLFQPPVELSEPLVSVCPNPIVSKRGNFTILLLALPLNG